MAAASVQVKESFLQWSEEEARNFGKIPQVNRHRVHELPLFSNESLLQLLENYPRTKMRVFSSGADPEKREQDWQPVDTEGASAADILQAVKVGRMWVNMQRVDAVDPRFRDLGNRLYEELAERCPHFKPLWTNRAFLFVSSPKAMVYLHADYQPNMLWHIRGTKTIWIYPAYDERIVTHERITEICSGGEDDLVYKPEFEAFGKAFTVNPGDTVSWPARAPHRVQNGDSLNVSLSTFHETVDDYEKVMDHRAEYFFRQTFPAALKLGKAGESLRRLAFKASQRAGMEKSRPVKEFYAHYRIDPTEPLGIKKIPGGPVLTEHSRLVKAAANK